jgi:hypothetical protein
LGGDRRRSVGDGLAGLAHASTDRVDRDRLAFLDDALQQHAFLEGFYVHVRLVGLDLEEHVALRDHVALALEPGDQSAFLGHLAGLRHEYRMSHGVPHGVGGRGVLQ